MCPTCPFRDVANQSETLARFLSNPDQHPSPSGWDVGECHDRVGDACAGYEAAIALDKGALTCHTSLP